MVRERVSKRRNEIKNRKRFFNRDGTRLQKKKNKRKGHVKF